MSIIHFRTLDEFIACANSTIQHAWSELRPILRQEKPHKVYMAEMLYRPNGRLINKFGYTVCADALDRFNLAKTTNKGWVDFKIRILDSFFCKDEKDAKMVERILQNKFPRNIYLDSYLGHIVPDGSRLSGVTETLAFRQGNQEGNLSPRPEVVLYSRGFGMEFFRHIKKCYLEGLEYPIVTEKKPCKPEEGLLYEEVENALSN